MILCVAELLKDRRRAKNNRCCQEIDIAHSVVSRLWKSFKTTGMCSRRHGEVVLEVRRLQKTDISSYQQKKQAHHSSAGGKSVSCCLRKADLPKNGCQTNIRLQFEESVVSVTNAACLTKSDRDPRNSLRLRARIFTPVVSLSFEHHAGEHPGSGQRPPLLPTTRKDLWLDGYLEYPHAAKALYIYKHPCLLRDSNQAPTAPQSASLTTIPVGRLVQEIPPINAASKSI
ncbi:uncharacterized protein TNCV_785881 [Trichonephila clavipes]|nr:uncharacterized protein TNCV_785881 [Trichonephila clavipes]